MGVSFPTCRTEGSDLESQFVKEVLEIARKVSL